MSNTRKIKSSRPSLPRCPDCRSRTTRRHDGKNTVVNLSHQRGCPAWSGVTPDAAETYAEAIAAADPGRTVHFARGLRLQIPERETR